ncbi:SacI homology domain containing protein [Nitzschia inconspicua]|uniref:SacI homology domain containing protein n=1 Tax=Nitzschia inconspicua TaxID=303405 RepID=A0A9K3PD02_9STRA|nr:SacI homology domain containing protein [Nitzschia inconspicua]
MPPLRVQDQQDDSFKNEEGEGLLMNVPTVDLSNSSEDEIVSQIADACHEFGFFQIVHHSVPEPLIDEYLEQCRLYFALPISTKQQWKRHDTNARGWFNDELTKQKRDWKEALDLGVPGTRDWTLKDDDPSNHCLDGWNQLPSTEILPNFKRVVTQYFDECAKLADQIAIWMAKGLGETDVNHPMLQELRDHHSSYLRSNYYPLCNELDEDCVTKPLGISPHRDAGFLTVLLQDADCHSLQVLSKQDDKNSWVTIHPASKYAFTINTGDMAEVWSNGLYKAPLHRVLSHETQERYSTPFFYNPPYTTLVEPLTIIRNRPVQPIYHGVLWGYFRAVRFAGDLTDLGVEIQVADFLKNNGTKSSHLAKQDIFAKEADFTVPFSVDKYRHLLQGTGEMFQDSNDAIEGSSNDGSKKKTGKSNGNTMASFSLLTFLAICFLLATMVDASTTSTSRNPFSKERTGVSGFGSRSIKKTIFPVSPSISATEPSSKLKSLRGEDEPDILDPKDDEDYSEESSDSWMEDSQATLETLSRQNKALLEVDATTEQDTDDVDDGFDYLAGNSSKELWVQRSDDDPSVLWVRVGSDNKLTLQLSVSEETGDWKVERKSPSRSFLKRYPAEEWVPIEGFYGLYRVPSGILWVLVTKTEPVYSAPPLKSSTSSWLEIRRVVNLEIVHLSRPIAGDNSLTPLQLREEVRQLKLLRKALKQHDFYYIPNGQDSDSQFQDMTITLQRSLLKNRNANTEKSAAWWRTEESETNDAIGLPDPRFFWNQHAVEPLVQRYHGSAPKRNLVDVMLQNVVPVTSAFVGVQRNISIEADTKKQNQLLSYDELLISRRSRFRAGTRFTVRGADATGAVANFVETEQVCLVTSANEDGERQLESIASHVQIRGSIPLRWSSPADVKTYRPRIRIGTDPLAQARAMRLHLLDQLSHYVPEEFNDRSPDVANIVFVNLVDKKSDQGRLGHAFDSILKAVMDVYSNSTGDATSTTSGEAAGSLLKPNTAQHVWYDFHAEVKEGRWDRLSMLLEEVQPSLDSHGYFYAEAPRTGQEWSIKQVQNAVVRTNCMDCLDRTNVVQSIFGRYMLFRQLSAVTGKTKKKQWAKLKSAFETNTLSLPWENGECAHRLLWADNADAISRLYAGTAALKGDFTRTGKRTKLGALDDGLNSLQRYYLNNFLDADRQEGYDLMVGYANFSNMEEMPSEISELADADADDTPDDTNSTLSDHADASESRSTHSSIREAARVSMLGEIVQSKTFQNREDIRSRLQDIGIRPESINDGLEEALDLRWLPGDLQTHMRSQANDKAVNKPIVQTPDNMIPKKSFSEKDGFQMQTALRAIDERSTHIDPWWTASSENWLVVERRAGSDYSVEKQSDLLLTANSLWLAVVLILGIKFPSMVAGSALALLLFVYLPVCLQSDWQQRTKLEGLLARLPNSKQTNRS